MQNILWRGIALSLAGCLSWLLWHWPEREQPVEFDITDCETATALPPDVWAECESERVSMTPERAKQLNFAREQHARESAAAMAKIEKNQRCIGGELFIKTGAEWRNVGRC